MDCTEFLDGYSSYLDGLVSPQQEEEFARHIDACDACARYDRVVQRGLEIFRNLPRVEPSSDFLPRLRHRLYHVDDGIPFHTVRHGGSAAAVAVAAVGLLALSWLPFAASMPVEVELPTVAVEAPADRGALGVPSLFEPGPFLHPDGEGVEWGRASVPLHRGGGASWPDLKPARSFMVSSGGSVSGLGR